MRRASFWADVRDLQLNKPWLWIPATPPLVLGLAFAVGESMGWPFLVAPLQSQLQQRMGRSLRLQATEGTEAAAPVSLHFWGSIRLQSPLLEIGAPAWSTAPYLLVRTSH